MTLLGGARGLLRTCRFFLEKSTRSIDLSTQSTHYPNMSTNGENLNTSNQWIPDQPFNSIPELPPPVDIESKAVLKACIEARARLAELKQAAELIPNQGVLINTLPLLEAQSSSEIENIVTTTDSLFRYRDVDSEADPATREALRYSKSLFKGFQSLASHPLSTRIAEEVCSEIKGMEMHVRKIPGTALASSVSGQVVYTPPVGEDLLRSLLGNWERFMHGATELDPLVRLAVGHYQFEAIHPFTDGNGRTGRVLNSLFLIQENLLGLPILYLSRYIIQNKEQYYQLLRDVTQHGNWEAWILYILRGISETSLWTTKKISAIRRLQEHTRAFLKENESRASDHDLIELIFELPYCRISDLVDRDIAKRQAASSHLHALVRQGVLIAKTVGREKLFIHPKLLNLLTRDSNDFTEYQPFPVSTENAGDEETSS